MTADPRLTYSTRVRETIDGLLLRDRMDNAQLARRLGISKTAVGKWRQGTSVPNPQMAVALSDLAGVSIRWLIVGTGARQVTKTHVSADVLRIAQKLAQVPSDSLDVLREVFSNAPAPDVTLTPSKGSAPKKP